MGPLAMKEISLSVDDSLLASALCIDFVYRWLCRDERDHCIYIFWSLWYHLRYQVTQVGFNSRY